MQTKYAIGIMSGTSADGADAVLIQLGKKISLIDAQSIAFDTNLQQQIHNLYRQPVHLLELGQLHTKLATLYSEISNQLISRHTDKKIIVIGCHGQTIFHHPQPPYPFSLQIGNSALLSQQTGLPVVCDFRNNDIALGGQGAPLVPPFHQALFHDYSPCAIINIGGISNITLLDNDKDGIKGYDIGPGNTLIDDCMRRYFGLPYDSNGQQAEKGQCHDALISDMLNDEYFRLHPPKSTGFEYFNQSWLQSYTDRHTFLSAEDIICSVTTLTAQTIANELKRLCIKRAFICGGGAHNTFLLNQIAKRSDCQIQNSADIGIDPCQIEAAAFAWMAWQTLEHKCSVYKSVTGAQTNSIAGCIYWPAHSLQTN